MQTSVYRGKRTRTGCRVYRDGRILDPRFDLARHSPTGFEWGYPGSGPAQLALAIMADALGDDQRALCLYQGFKVRVISRLRQDRPGQDTWAITRADVLRIASEIEADVGSEAR